MILTPLADEHPNTPAANAEIKAFDAMNRQIMRHKRLTSKNW
jgi:hypothetical protein